MPSENLVLDREGAVLVVAINRPRVLNALDAATLAELHRAMDAAASDETVRVVILTGAGERAFAAGADIKELAAQTPAGARDHARVGQALCDRIERLGKPVIAAVNGFALGAGCELAMACAIRLAADSATIGQPEVNLGLVPGFGGSQRLARLVGRGRALELLLTGEPIGADEAFRIGLVNRVLPASQLMAAARQLARALAAKPPVAVRYVLDLVAAGAELPLDGALALEAALFGLTFSTDDMREGTRAFLDKRAPDFKGR